MVTGGEVGGRLGGQEGTCPDEHRVMDGGAGSLYRTPGTGVPLCVNHLELQ